MQFCQYHASCFFFSDPKMSIPRTREILKNAYCAKDYSRCAIYRRAKIHGIRNVPTHVQPDDFCRSIT